MLILLCVKQIFLLTFGLRRVNGVNNLNVNLKGHVKKL